jgi:4-hydroxybenzoate polyprenyltransferase
MTKIKKDPRPLLVRLWIFQRERAPLYGVAIMALVTCGVIYNFASSPLRNYLTAAIIIALYLLQIRTADEKKDFDHDNKYHPTRPVQRGIVTLGELAVINKLCIGLQLLLYASFLDWRIFGLGLLSQGYAILTKKEFFVRDWIRQHFYIYYLTHYVQLVILFYAMTQIIQPKVINSWVFVGLFMAGVITTELGRKMFAVEDDTTDDTYSAQLGHGGSAIAISTLATIMTLIAFYLINHGVQNYLFIIGPVIALGLVINNAYHYSIEPNKKNSKNIELASNILYVVTMLSVILGA